MTDDDKRLVAGRYRLASRLGSGGMGVVWQAYDERLHRRVAMKQLLLPAGLSGDEAAAAKHKVMREGRIAARLQHRHAVMVYDVAEDDGQPFLVMEYLPSKSLADVLSERGPLPVGQVARIGAQIAAALAAAHAAGVVHRDVKPANVLLGENGQVKITDFGISRAVEDATGTMTGIIAGTPAYLSPEVARGHKATYSSDVFSLGSTLYAAVEGGPPFGTADNAMALLYRVASEPITQPRQAGPLTEVLLSLLATDPDHRPTMAEARDALAAVADHAATQPDHPPASAQPDPAPAPAEPDTEVAHSATGTPSAFPSPRQPAPARPARKRLAVLAAAAVAVLAVAVLALLLDRDEPGRGTAAPPATSSSPEQTTQAEPPPASSPSSPTSSPLPPSGEANPPATAAPPPATGGPAEPLDPAEARRRAIIDYYALMPGNLEEGWTWLTPKYQQSPAGGFGGYQAFWNQMRSVQVSEVTVEPGGTIGATVVYTRTNGEVVRERHSYSLIVQQGRWLIDGSTVISSVTG